MTDPVTGTVTEPDIHDLLGDPPEGDGRRPDPERVERALDHQARLREARIWHGKGATA